MTASVLIQLNCDASGCTRHVRSSHWTSLGAQSEARAKMRRAGWRVVGSPEENNKGNRRHFCPEHADAAQWTQQPHDSPADTLRERWVSDRL